MADKAKQQKINFLLENEIFSHLTYLYNFWGESSNTSYTIDNILEAIDNDKSGVLEFVCEVSFASDEFISIV